MVAPAMVAAAAPIIGSVFGGLFGRSSAKKSMRFQREMAQKGHQYEVADLRAAGLNPILSATGGPGAKASGGAMPQTPDFASSAVSSMLLKKQADLLDAQIKKTDNEGDILSLKGSFTEDMDKLYQGAKNTFSAKNLSEGRAKYQKSLRSTPPGVQKRIDRAKKKGNVKTYPYGTKPGKSSGFKKQHDRFSYGAIIGRTR